MGLGILMGSVVLEQAFVENLESNLDELRKDKLELQDDVLALDRQLDADLRFAEVAEGWLVDRALDGRKLVVLEFEGSDDRIEEGIEETIQTAGGEVTTRIALTDKLALRDRVERDQLALVVGSVSGAAAQLRREAGQLLGEAIARVSSADTRGERVEGATPEAERVLFELEEAGFVDVDGGSEAGVIPARADFLLVGGSDDRRPFNLPAFATELTEAVVQSNASILVAESSDSAWELVASVRSSDIEDQVSTVDHAETIAGRIAAVLAFAQTGESGHYGTGPGATEVIPEPNAGS